MRRRLLPVLAIILAAMGVLALPSAAAAAPLTGVTQLDAGTGDTPCARTANGQVRCWGRNANGQVGDGTTTDRSRARIVRTFQGTPLSGVAEVVGGALFTCARLTNGQARCWGSNLYGQLGDATNTDRLRPVPVRAVSGAGPLQDVVDLTAGAEHACAVLESGQARCWGHNVLGGLGDTSTDDRNRPVVVTNTLASGPMTQVAEISAGEHFTCARLRNGEARCWGTNFYGQVGDGSGDVSTAIPRKVLNQSGTTPLRGITQLDSGTSSTCVRTTNGQARCWGEGVGRMGNGSNADSEIPTNVLNASGTADLTNVSSVAVGGNVACARLGNGQGRCWGQDGYQQLGNGPATNSTALLPVVVQAANGTAMSGVNRLSPGALTSCALLGTGQVRCWGANDSGQTGDGTTVSPRGSARIVQV